MICIDMEPRRSREDIEKTLDSMGLKDRLSARQIFLRIGGFALFSVVLFLVLYFAVGIQAAVGALVFGLVLTIALVLYYTGWGYAFLFTRSRPFSENWKIELAVRRAKGLQKVGQFRQGAEIYTGFTIRQGNIARQFNPSEKSGQKKKAPPIVSSKQKIIRKLSEGKNLVEGPENMLTEYFSLNPESEASVVVDELKMPLRNL